MASALVLALLLPGLFRAGPPMDEGQLVAYPQWIGAGLVPQVDFEYSYGPANLWALSLVFAVLGPGVGAERLLGLVYRLAIVVALYGIAVGLVGRDTIGAPARVAEHRPALVAVLAAAFLAEPGCCAYAWFGGMACATWSVRVGMLALARGDPRWHFGAGLLGGIALGFRPDLAVAVCLPALALGTSTRRDAAAQVLGGAAGLSVLALHVGRIGLDRWWQAAVVETLVEAAPGRRLPIPPAEPLAAVLFGAVLLATGALVLTTAQVHAEDRRAPVRAWTAVAVLSVACLAQALQRADPTHCVYAGCVAVPLAALAARDFRACLEVVARGAVVGIAVLASVALGASALSTPMRWVERGDRAFPLDQTYAASARCMVDALDTRAAAGDTLFVGPRDLRFAPYGDTFFYFLFPELRPASYFTEMNPGVANRPGSRLADDLRNADFLILSRRYDEWDEPNESARAGPDAPRNVVVEVFCPIAAADELELFERCDRRSELRGP